MATFDYALFAQRYAGDSIGPSTRRVVVDEGSRCTADVQVDEADDGGGRIAVTATCGGQPQNGLARCHGMKRPNRVKAESRNYRDVSTSSASEAAPAVRGRRRNDPYEGRQTQLKAADDEKVLQHGLMWHASWLSNHATTSLPTQWVASPAMSLVWFLHQLVEEVRQHLVKRHHL